MKRLLFVVMMGVVAVCASATDRFYIEDFTIAAGETRMVCILLDNESSFTAFQTDIYMPEGLMIEEEDGDYIFDLTSRKARDHNIASQPQPNGSIRIMSYSPGVKAYSGSSGALVTFSATASADFTGPVTIQLKNTLFTTTSGVEIPLSDEVCNVTVPSTVHKGDVNGDNFVTIADVSALIDYLLDAESVTINVQNADVNENGDITIADVSALIDMLLNGA